MTDVFKYPTYQVGGSLRDEYLKEIHGVVRGRKDVDIAVEAPSFKAMYDWCEEQKFRIHDVHEQFLTVRCGIPPDHALRDWGKDLDVTMCRVDGPYSDGRHPDWTRPGTVWEDLARRDARCNAIARNIETGEILDPHDGIGDIRVRVISTVGNPLDRWREDGLRVLRHFRQAIELDFELDNEISLYLLTEWEEVFDLIRLQNKERRYGELHKMFKADTPMALQLLAVPLNRFLEAIFADGLWLEPTLKER